MFDTKRIAGDFSEAAGGYDARAELQARIGAELIEKAAPHLAANGVLLDVGAGSGEVTRHWPVGQRIALDMAFGMCRQARGKKLLAVNASAAQLPLQTASMDAVTSNLMLQWLEAPQGFFADALRVLKPGGILAVASFVEGTLLELTQAFANAGQARRVSDFMAPALLVEMVRSAGFEVVSQEQKTIREPYHGVMDLFHFLRAIGAGNKRADRPRGLATPALMRRVADHYPHEKKGITASWAVQFIVARKM